MNTACVITGHMAGTVTNGECPFHNRASCYYVKFIAVTATQVCALHHSLHALLAYAFPFIPFISLPGVCAILGTSFGGKRAHLRRWLFTQPSSTVWWSQMCKAPGIISLLPLGGIHTLRHTLRGRRGSTNCDIVRQGGGGVLNFVTSHFKNSIKVILHVSTKLKQFY